MNTPLILYRKDCDDENSGFHTDGYCINEVGSFRRIQWCKPHDTDCFDEYPTGFDEYCEAVEVWQEIPR